MHDAGVVLQRVFDALVAKLKATPQFSLPRQQFIQTGSLPQDCELFAVHANKIYPGTPGQPRPGYQDATYGITMYAMDIGVSLIREQPLIDQAGRIPLATDLTKATMQASKDATAMTNAYHASVADGSLVDPCDTIYFGGVDFIGPMGGVLETMLNISIQL